MPESLIARIAISPAELVATRARSPIRDLTREDTNFNGAAPAWLTYTPPPGFGVGLGFLRIVLDDIGAPGTPTPRARLVLTNGSVTETHNLGYVPEAADWYIKWDTPLVTTLDTVLSIQLEGLTNASRYSVWAEVFLIKLKAEIAGLASTSGVAP